MHETSADVIRQYLVDAIAAEKNFETQLNGFARDGDDDEVRAFFLRHAAETRSQYERLEKRRDELGGGGVSTVKSPIEVVAAPQLVSETEGRTLQHLIAAFAIESCECALYESLAVMASAGGDETTESLAREIQAEEKEAAERTWHFIPSRSKIAFNMLTVTEVDPAVETRTDADRITTT